MPASSATVTLVVALLTLVVSVTLVEWALARRGFAATAIDSEDLWQRQRAAASSTPGSIVILGSSRAQVDIDLAVTAAVSGRQPLQLAIDNNSFMPILAGLARDPAFRGVVIVDYLERYLVPGRRDQIARAYEGNYWRTRDLRSFSPSQRSEAVLGDLLRSRLRIYADGAQPITNVLTRLLDPQASPQYMVTLPDRSRRADYSKLPMPQFRYRTVARYLDLPIPSLPWEQGLPAVEAHLRRTIQALAPADREIILRSIAEVSGYADSIEARGGRVVFVRMPSCGLILEADLQLYPRTPYWDALVAANPGRTIHYADHPTMAALNCPDDSHLDQRDVAGFTRELMQIVQALP